MLPGATKEQQCRCQHRSSVALGVALGGMDPNDSESNVQLDGGATLYKRYGPTGMTLSDEEDAPNEHSRLLGPQIVPIEDERAVRRKQISVSVGDGSSSADLM